eukprot:gene51982-63555_t
MPGRSTIYGLFLLAGHFGHFWPVVAIQSALCVWVIMLALRAHGLGHQPLTLLGTSAVLALFTALPFVSGQLMPDVFAGIGLCALYLLIWKRASLGRGETLGLAVLAAVSGACHSSVLAAQVLVLLAALIGLGLVAKSVLDQGPVVEVSFRSGDGLEAGKTKVKYKDVDIGIVRTIALKEDLSKVLVTIEMTKEARRFTAADTRFWVVRPRVGASGVSGLGTLLSGAYIGVDAGKGALGADKFTGLERAPPVTVDQKGSQFT